MKNIWKKIGIDGNIAIHIDSETDSRIGRKICEEFQFFEIENLEMFCSEGADFCSELLEKGFHTDARNSESPEEMKRSGIHANDAKLPGYFDIF
jgi:hypothetical protein